MDPYQFPSQPGQCALYVQFSASLCSLAAFTEALGPASRIPARTLSCWLTVIKGGVLAGEVPQSGEDHFHHVRSVMSSVLLFSTLCGVVRCSRLWLQIQPRLLSWDDPLEFWRLVRNSLCVFSLPSTLLPPSSPSLCCLFSCLLSLKHYILAPWWTGITEGWMWRSRSDVRALSWCLTGRCLLLLWPFLLDTHTQRSLGWRGGEEAGGCHGDNSCVSLKILGLAMVLVS